MIGITGHMSGGKTYFAVEWMLQLFASGHVCCSNIRLNCRGVTDTLGLPCVCWKRLYYFLTDDNSMGYNVIPLRDYELYPMGSPRGSPTYDRDMVYIFLDEASSCFDSMAHVSEAGIQRVATWARHTRKRGQEVVLIMQFASELHKRLRVHILEFVSCVNTSSIKIPFLGTGLPWFLSGWSVRTRYLQDGETRVGSASWVRINPSVYRCYNTAQIVVGSQIGVHTDICLDFTERHNRQVLRSFVALAVLSLLSFVSFAGVLLWLL